MVRLDTFIGFKLILLSFTLSLFLSTCKTASGVKDSSADLKYFGKDNKLAEMTYESEMWYFLPKDWKGPIENLLTDPTTSGEIREQLDLQVAHIFAALTTHPGYDVKPGVIANNYKLDQLVVKPTDDKKIVSVSYRFRDRIALHEDLLKGDKPEITFVLPKEVTKIYEKGFTSSSDLNLCTDDHYNEESDFWYFWNPKQKGCPLKKDDLVTVIGKLKLLPSTANTFPEYDMLHGDNGNGKELKVVALFGIDESFRSGDLGRSAYQNFMNILRDNNYVKIVDENKHKVFTLPNEKRFKLQLHVHLVDPDDEEFDELVVDALNGNGKVENAADIFLYDGHSGLGGHLAPGRFSDFIGKKLKLHKNKYQVFAFQGCTTYAYYNKNYFDLKKTSEDRFGSKFLDIITAGIGLQFSSGPMQDFVIVNGLLKGGKPTWQKIITDIYNVDPEATALHQINGDEDNPTTR